MITKVCTRCNTDKPLSEFAIRKRMKTIINYVLPECKQCASDRTRIHRESEHGKKLLRAYKLSPNGKARHLFKESQRSARKKDIAFDLTSEWIRERVALGKCQVTGIPFDMEPAGSNGAARAFGASLDRIDPTKGYTQDNVQVVVWIYNRAKGVQSHTEVLTLAEALCQKR